MGQSHVFDEQNALTVTKLSQRPHDLLVAINCVGSKVLIPLRGQKQLNSLLDGFGIRARPARQNVLKLLFKLASLVLNGSPVFFFRGPTALHAFVSSLHPRVCLSVPAATNDVRLEPDRAVAALIIFFSLMFASFCVSSVECDSHGGPNEQYTQQHTGVNGLYLITNRRVK